MKKFNIKTEFYVKECFVVMSHVICMYNQEITFVEILDSHDIIFPNIA